VDIGNQTIVNVGFYDFDSDGFREFFNGTVKNTANQTIWKGASVTQGNSLAGADGYPDPNWNGYTYLGEDGNRRTFSQVNELLGGSALTAASLGSGGLAAALTTASDWLEVSFDVVGSSGSSVVQTVITMAAEAFTAIGMNAVGRFITFASLLQKLQAGDFYGVFFSYAGLSPDPTFMQLFYSGAPVNQQRSRWYNKTYDDLWNIIDRSSDFDIVLAAAYKAQQMYWQEQPLVVMYNNELTSMYRVDKFDGFIIVPGTGAFTG
jgi:ABC-type transport system substrate-binding protein